MGRHSDDEPSLPGDWEEPPDVAPVWRARIVTSAVLLLAVLAGTWWAVSWLTSPAGPGGAGTPPAASLPGPASTVRDASGDPAPADPVTAGSPTGGAAAGGPRPGGTPAQGGPGSARGGGGTPLTVHVAGEVHEPGLVEVSAGARVADALVAAGGPTDEAVLDRLNLAAPAVDASQILVPGPDTAETAEGAVATAPGPAATAGSATGGSGASGAGGGTVNVNTADAATLEQLPGIGPALAGRIVAHREQVGPFGSLEDLDAVSGIGPAMMERLEGLVSW